MLERGTNGFRPNSFFHTTFTTAHVHINVIYALMLNILAYNIHICTQFPKLFKFSSIFSFLICPNKKSFHFINVSYGMDSMFGLCSSLQCFGYGYILHGAHVSILLTIWCVAARLHPFHIGSLQLSLTHKPRDPPNESPIHFDR